MEGEKQTGKAETKGQIFLFLGTHDKHKTLGPFMLIPTDFPASSLTA